MQPATLRSILRFLFDRLTVHGAVGAENVPPQGAYLVATNHMSRLDLPLLYIDIPRPDLIALVADSYRLNPLFYFIIQSSRSIWIDRGKADFAAMRAGMEHLRRGGLLGIAPEGTRSQVSALLEAKTGVAMLADKARVPVIPVALEGSESSMRELRRLRRPRMWVHFGKPFMLPPLDRADREGSLLRNTDEIMCRIAAMLPAHYRGFYADHPRLKELLAESQEVSPQRSGEPNGHTEMGSEEK
ncbi:MAG TPA: lysophospholipid acyltransferase family protein, partial [Anaerolineaceae bacterium]